MKNYYGANLEIIFGVYLTLTKMVDWNISVAIFGKQTVRPIMEHHILYYVNKMQKWVVQFISVRSEQKSRNKVVHSISAYTQ